MVKKCASRAINYPVTVHWLISLAPNVRLFATMKLLAFLAVLLMGLSLVMVPGSASPADCPQVTRKPRNATTYKITSDMLQLIQNLASG